MTELRLDVPPAGNGSGPVPGLPLAPPAPPPRPILAGRPISLSSLQRTASGTASPTRADNRPGPVAAPGGLPPSSPLAVLAPPAEHTTVPRPAAPVAVQRFPALPGLAPPSLPSVPGMPALPSLPTAPGMPALPSLPTAPGMPALPSLPTAPSLPAMPGLPAVPGLPAGMPDVGGLAGDALGAAGGAARGLADQAVGAATGAAQQAVGAAGDAAAGALGAATGALGALGNDQLEELAKGLYDKIRQRLKAELRLDRERYGRVTDLAR